MLLILLPYISLPYSAVCRKVAAAQKLAVTYNAREHATCLRRNLLIGITGSLFTYNLWLTRVSWPEL